MSKGEQDMTIRLIFLKAGLGAGMPVARRTWLRTLKQIRALPEHPGKESK